MVTYSVQFGGMQSATEGLAQVYQQLTQIGEDLKNQVQQGTVEFQGNTKDQFIQAQQQYDQAHAELANSMNSASAALGNVHQEYNTAENKGTQLWAH